MSNTRRDTRVQPPTFEQVDSRPVQVCGTVGPEHLDENGHMNIRHYFGLGDDTLVNRFSALGFKDGYVEARGLTTFTAAHHLQYLAELAPGAAFSCHSLLLARSARSLHALVLGLDRTTRRLSFTFEAIIVHVDIVDRRAVPFPDDIAVVIDTAVARDTVDWPVPISGCLGVRYRS